MTRRFRAVTTCSPAGWEQYGARMVETFRVFWPEEVNLSLYADGFNAPLLPGVDLRHLPGWLDAFKGRNKPSVAANGRAGKSYNFKFDAIKFSHKTAAVIDAAMVQDCDVLVWIDGDTVFHGLVTMEFLESLMPDDCAVAWLDRIGNYPECGLYCLNLRHPATPAIMARWKALYLFDQVFDLDEWHDSFVFQKVVEEFKAPWHSLSGDARKTSHPAINGPLGMILDHMKGPRKEAGRSRDRDLTAPRSEAYWSRT